MNKLKQIFTFITISALFSIRAYSQQNYPTNIPVTNSGDRSETAIAVDQPINDYKLYFAISIIS